MTVGDFLSLLERPSAATSEELYLAQSPFLAPGSALSPLAQMLCPPFCITKAPNPHATPAPALAPALALDPALGPALGRSRQRDGRWPRFAVDPCSVRRLRGGGLWGFGPDRGSESEGRSARAVGGARHRGEPLGLPCRRQHGHPLRLPPQPPPGHTPFPGPLSWHTTEPLPALPRATLLPGAVAA